MSMFNKAGKSILEKTKGLRESFAHLHKDERGQGMAEYGLILALIAVVVIGALTLIGTRMLNKFNSVSGALQ